ncbi:MAG: CRISPR system precrRNA processing endoribonuclease RAMP protein Cas6, partial [Chloroflexi bacterium]|nr:CRISPR system precrRNA processing endoribonuclease RAMP protein Cas6 [Chloroflexota bacterium]
GLRFLTPMRLVAGEQLVKMPDFGVLFARLLERIDQLDRQFCGGGRRDDADRLALQGGADRVRLVDANTQWVEVRSGSTRRGEPTWISGFVGQATYAAPPEVWAPLLPWLLWGQLTQVGKDVVKGNGVYRVLSSEYRVLSTEC